MSDSPLATLRKQGAKTLKPSYASIDEIFEEMEVYGYPNIWTSEYGWHCQLEVHIIPEGTSMKIESKRHKKAFDAALECLDRTVKAINELLGL